MSAHTTWEELAAGYALHALEPAEEQAFVDHLGQCAMCERAVGDHELVTAQLAVLSEGAPPPPELWSGIHAALEPRPVGEGMPVLHAVPTAEPSRSFDPVPSGEPSRSVAPVPSGEPANDESPAPRRTRRRWMRPQLAAAAAVLVAAAAGVGSWQAVEHTGATPTQTRVSQCQDESGCDVVPLRAGGAKKAVLMVRGRRVQMASPGLPKLPKNQTYVFWQLSKNDGPVGVQAFTDPARSHAMSLPIAVTQTTAFAISREHGHTIPDAPSNIVTRAPATD